MTGLKTAAGLLLACSFLIANGGAGAHAAGTISSYRLLVLNGETVKWGAARLGAGAVVTYAVTSAPRDFSGARNCPELVPLDGLLGASAISRPAFDAALEEALAAWSATADVTFRPADEASADILIGAQGQPIGRAFTNVATRAMAPESAAGGVATIAASLICLNPQQAWKTHFDGNLEVYDLRYTLMHEIGHAIGLDHPGSRDALMDFRYLEAFETLQAGDRDGAALLYGPPRETVADAIP